MTTSTHRSSLFFVTMAAYIVLMVYAIIFGGETAWGVIGLSSIILIFLVVMSFTTGFPFGGQMRGGF